MKVGQYWLGRGVRTIGIAAVAFACGFGVAAQKNNFVYQAIRGVYVDATRAFDPAKTPRWQAMVEQFDVVDGHSQVYMIGDSITEGARWSEMFPDVRIANRGISGDGISGVLSRAIQIPPGIVMFLMVGTNDVTHGESSEEIERNYRRLIDTLSTKGKLFVQSTLFTKYADRNEKIARLNSVLQNICGTQPTKCVYVDLNSAIAPTGTLENDVTFDGQHLNGAGYVKWKRIIAPIIDRATANTATPPSG